ncbi:MAG: amidohydrolase [Dehalococcoidia bacterium]|nr:MAG: amidohydrolase [Dehalococcoidia bacterium]
MKRIAIEEHFTTKESFHGSPVIGSGKNPDDISNIPKRLQDMDESGIDMQVLSFVFNGESLEAGTAIGIVKRANDELAALVQQYPRRFAGFASIALHDPAAAADELERAVTHLGLKGTMIFSTYRGEYLDDQKYRVILERAEKLGVPVYLHPGHPPKDMIKPFMTYPILSGSMFGYAVETGLHAMRLICSGTFDRFPGLKIILGHLGEGLPFWLWRMDNRWQREKDTVYNSDVASGKLLRRPSQYLKDNFYVSTSGMFWPPALQFVQSVLGADRIMFGVDYPQESSIEAVKAIESCSFSDADKAKIFHLNAEKILAIK